MVQRDVELFANAARVLQVGSRGTITVVVFPIGHVQRLHVCAGLLKKDSSYCRVHTTRQTQYDFTIVDIPLHTGMLASLNEVCVSEHGIDVVLQRQHSRQQVVRLTLTCLIVVDAAQYDRCTQAAPALLKICASKPTARDNTIVELAAPVARQELCSVDDAQKLLPSLRVYPQIHADEFAAGNITAGLFKGFSNDGFFGGFAGLDMAARLIQDNLAHRVFFDKQILAIVFDDR